MRFLQEHGCQLVGSDKEEEEEALQALRTRFLDFLTRSEGEDTDKDKEDSNNEEEDVLQALRTRFLAFLSHSSSSDPPILHKMTSGGGGGDRRGGEIEREREREPFIGCSNFVSSKAASQPDGARKFTASQPATSVIKASPCASRPCAARFFLRVGLACPHTLC